MRRWAMQGGIMTTVVGIGTDKIEYCGSLTESESGMFIVAASREIPPEVAVGREMRLTFVSEGKIEMRSARLVERLRGRFTFAPIGEAITVRRRMEARIAACLAVDYRTENGEFRKTETENISINGLALREPQDATLPDRTELRVTLPAHGKAARAVVAMGGVVNRRVLRNGETVAGILLLEMAAEDRAAFHQFFEAQTERQEALAA